MPTGGSITIEERVAVPASAFDHAGYRAWVTSGAYPDGVRTTYLGGEVLVEMSPESIETHNKVKTAMTIAIGAFVREHDLGEAYSDGLLLTNEPAGLSTEPGLCVVSWARFGEDRVRLRHRPANPVDYIELIGSPDLVVEIVSDSSVRKDTTQLREAYRRAGVAEYWLVDARGPDIRFEILSNAGETLVRSADPSAPQVSRVLGGQWSLIRGRNRAGRFVYDLLRS